MTLNGLLDSRFILVTNISYLFINEKERNVSKHLFYFDFKAKIIRIQPAKKKLYLKSKSCQEILHAAILPTVLLELLW